MKNTATIAICHLVVLKTYVDISEPYAPMSCCYSAEGSLAARPWILKSTSTGQNLLLGLVPNCARRSGRSVERDRVPAEERWDQGRVVLGIPSRDVPRVQTPGACGCAGRLQEQAQSPPRAHLAADTHGCALLCCAVLCSAVPCCAGRPLRAPACWAGSAAITSAA